MTKKKENDDIIRFVETVIISFATSAFYALFVDDWVRSLKQPASNSGNI